MTEKQVLYVSRYVCLTSSRKKKQQKELSEAFPSIFNQWSQIKYIFPLVIALFWTLIPSNFWDLMMYLSIQEDIMEICGWSEWRQVRAEGC